MTEEKEEGKKDWIAWVKHLVAAVVGAIVTLLATIGVIGKDDAAIAKDKADAVLDKSEQAYVQVTEVSTAVAEVKQLLDDKKYVEAIKALDAIGKSAKDTVTTVVELKDEISGIVKNVKEKIQEAKEKKEGSGE